MDDSVIATTTTAIDGSYRFNGLPQAYYRVQVTDTGNVLAAFTQTGDPDVLLDEQGNVPLLAGAVDLSMNFGYQNAALANVSGTTFDDTDTDGVQDPGENGLAGVSLDLVAPGSGRILRNDRRPDHRHDLHRRERQLQLPRRPERELPRARHATSGTS